MRTNNGGTSNRRSFLLKGATLAGTAMGPAFAARSRNRVSWSNWQKRAELQAPQAHRR